MTALVHKRGDMIGYIRNQKSTTEKRFHNTLMNHLGGFLVIGCITTCVDISLLWVFTDLCGLWYLVSAGLSYCTGALFSFGLNKSYNFKNASQNYVKQASAFLLIATSSLMVNLLIISLCVEVWSFNYLVAKVLATGVAFLWNYVGQSGVTFRLWS